MSSSYIRSRLRLLDLPPEVQDLLRKGEINISHAQAMVSLANTEDQKKLALAISHREVTKEEIKKYVATKKKRHFVYP